MITMITTPAPLSGSEVCALQHFALRMCRVSQEKCEITLISCICCETTRRQFCSSALLLTHRTALLHTHSHRSNTLFFSCNEDS